MSSTLLDLVNSMMHTVPSSPMEDQKVKEMLKAKIELDSNQSRVAKTNGIPSADMIDRRDAARETYIELSKTVIQWSKRNKEWESLIQKCAADLRSLQDGWEKYKEGMVFVEGRL